MPVSHMMLLKSTLKPLGILGGIPLPPPPSLVLPQPGEALRMLGAGLGGFWKPFLALICGPGWF